MTLVLIYDHLCSFETVLSIFGITWGYDWFVRVFNYFGVWSQVVHICKLFCQNKISILGYYKGNNRTYSQNYPQNILVFGGLSERSEHTCIFTDLIPWTSDTFHLSVRFLSVTVYKSYPSIPRATWVLMSLNLTGIFHSGMLYSTKESLDSGFRQMDFFR